MIRNPFGKPYLFSKKWAIWLLIGVPFVLYSNYTDPNFKRSELVTTTVTILMIFVILPWILIRITRAISGKDPQGKTYDENGLVIEGDVLNLKYGYFPRNRVRAILRDGVVEFPTSKIKVKDIQSIKTKRSASAQYQTSFICVNFHINTYLFLLHSSGCHPHYS